MEFRYVELLLLSLLYTTHPLGSHGLLCYDENGSKVDWFVMYKLPNSSEYYYLDATNPTWSKGKKLITANDNPIASTLIDVYRSQEKVLHLMYNDETPSGDKTSSRGHTKGVVAADKDAGFWLIHSVPKFPSAANETKSYSFPASGKKYGQTLLCISLSYSSMDSIGKLLYYNWPYIYDHSLPDEFVHDNPNLLNVTAGAHALEAPCTHTEVLTSIGGEHFTAFAKCAKFGKDLYADFVAKSTKSSLYVESWRNSPSPDLKNDCTSTYKVYNIEAVQLMSDHFCETNDHAKWAVAESHPVTCIGDINRQEAQERRGGGTVCFDKNSSVQQSFRKAVAATEKCPQHSHGTVAESVRFRIGE